MPKRSILTITDATQLVGQLFIRVVYTRATNSMV
jgi:hypothetical protein